MSQALNPITMPIQGVSLIEASAGTGKTFNIAALFTRLILLERLPIDTILVVTFTKAATAELKTRLRTRLNQALALLQNHLPPEQNDPILQQLIDIARTQDTDDNLILRLQAAITQFDRASVYTIHGFCQRILTDYAFLCQTPFDTETTNADPKLTCRFAEDFWRRQINNQTTEATLAVTNKLTPAKLTQEMGRYCGMIDLHIRQPPATDISACTTALQHTWQQICTHFTQIQHAFWQLHPQLNGNSYRQKTYEQLFSELEQAIQTPQPYCTLTTTFSQERLAKFTTSELHEKAKKGQTLKQEHLAKVAILAELGQAIAALQTAETYASLQLQTNCFQHVRQSLNEHRKNNHQRSYDDLLADVGTALSPSNPLAEKLAFSLAQTWQIALIDECQDTDPLQYHIFKTAFAEQNRPLIMVGDPKQAIYRFRGADIHAYLQAAIDTPSQQHYTLTTNYRSHQTLVQAVAHLFTAKEKPFILTGIDYPPITAQKKNSNLRSTTTTNTPPAIVVRWLHQNITTDDKGRETIPNKDSIRAQAAESCAYEIATLINQGQNKELYLGERPLQAGDIAVLVHSHNEGNMVAKALKRSGITSVSLGNQSVFNTIEAEAISALLRFWLQPQHTPTLRFILGGVLFGWTAAQLTELNQNENTLNTWIQLALSAREKWEQHGIYTAIQWFTNQTGLEIRLLNQRNERSLTNFWQLAELLATEEQTQPTTKALHNWLDNTINTTQPPSENALLRLESDEALVKIVTMHASKGLEYPIVFCPFAWDGKEAIKKPEQWHRLHNQKNIELVPKALLTDHDKEQLLQESMAEQLRLYYVAFTRAREQLILYSAACSNTANNPLAWLLDGQPANTLAESQFFWQQAQKNNLLLSTLHTAWQTRLQQTDNPELFQWVEGIATPQIVHPIHNTTQPYQALAIKQRPFSAIRYTSFTALSYHQQHNLEEEKLAPALDSAEVQPIPYTTETPAETPLLNFARGINAGLCLHAILEQTDFSSPADTNDPEQIQQTLAQFGFSTEHIDTMMTLIDTVRHTPLSTQSTIAHIPKQQQIAEMNFMLQINDFSIAFLQQWFAQPHLSLPAKCIQAAQQLDFTTVNGYINGAIDLICEDQNGQIYIIDYKSNHLGNQLNDYKKENMDEAIAKHHYYLQALIYSIACARYLQTQNKLPPMISIRYLFLRGLNSNDHNGIWQWDISTDDLTPWLSRHDKAK